MAHAVFITQSVAQALLTAFETAANAGTAAVLEIYNGTAPADADAAEANTLLASLTFSANIFLTKTDANPGALGTCDTITADSSADNTGSATHFRIKTQTGGTVVLQGSVGTSGADLNLNTVAISASSTVSCTSFTILQPES